MDEESVFPLPTRRATRELARRIAQHIVQSDLIVLSGPVGAGKTFFTRALCRALDVPARRRVTSPTFALVHEHTGRLGILHADLYRIETERQLFELGLEEQRDEGYVLVVEWGAPYLAHLGGDGLLVDLALEPRRARVSSTGRRSRTIARAITAENA